MRRALAARVRSGRNTSARLSDAVADGLPPRARRLAAPLGDQQGGRRHCRALRAPRGTAGRFRCRRASRGTPMPRRAGRATRSKTARAPHAGPMSRTTLECQARSRRCAAATCSSWTSAQAVATGQRFVRKERTGKPGIIDRPSPGGQMTAFRLKAEATRSKPVSARRSSAAPARSRGTRGVPPRPRAASAAARVRAACARTARPSNKPPCTSVRGGGRSRQHQRALAPLERLDPRRRARPRHRRDGPPCSQAGRRALPARVLPRTRGHAP